MLMKMFKRWREDTSGVVAMVVVFCVPAFIAAAGVAVDLAQAYNIKTRLSAALDKAALAAGNTTNMTDAQIEDRVNAFIAANYPEGALGESFDLNVLLTPGTVDIHARAKVKTVFMGIVCPDVDPCQYMSVFAETIVKKEVSGLELVLVLDTTGSMNDPAGGGVTKIDAAKSASNSLLNILYGSASNVPKLYVGVVPFSQNVNIGTDYASWTQSDSYDWGPGGSWMGCVEARWSGGNDVTVTLPTGANKFVKYYSACDTSSNLWRWTVGSEIATNGDFGVSTGWTQGNGWSIASGVATRISGSGNVATNGDFSSSGGWTLDTNWSIGSGHLNKAAPTDLSVNGDFSSSTGWTLGSGWGIGSGKLSKTNNTNSSTATRTPSVSLANGYDYEVTYTVSNRTAGSVRSTIGGTTGTSHSSNGTYTETITAGSGSTIGLSTTNGFKGDIDNFIVKQLETKTYRSPSIALVAGDQYEVVFTVTSRTAGSVQAVIGGTLGTARSTTGTFTQTITAGSSDGYIGFYTSNGFAGVIDSMTVTNLSDGNITRSPSSALDSSADYQVTFTITSYTSGSVKPLVGNTGGTSGSGTSRSAAGTYTEVINAGNGSTIGLKSSSFVGSIDNFSVKQLTKCGNGPTYAYASPLDSTQGPNKYCSAAMLPMTPTKSEIVNKVNALTAQGSTMINLGMVSAWRMLAPTWRGTWSGTMASADSPGPLPLDYGTNGMNKAVILMTDGDNSFGGGNYTAYRKLSDGNLGTTSSSTANTILNSKTATLCTNMKAQNILIYTVALGTDLNATSKQMLKDCATSPAYAFVSPTTSDLQTTFTTIANQLNSLYIVY